MSGKVVKLKNHVEFVDSYSSRESEHPTTVQVVSVATPQGKARGLREEVYMVQDASGHPSFAMGFHEGCNPLQGLNGYLTEDLVAILRHVFERYESSKFKCSENAEIVGHLKSIQELQLKRRRGRQERGVSGKREV